MSSQLCDEPLVHQFFSIIGRMGIFGLLMDGSNGLTLNQSRILFHLFYHGQRTMSEVANYLGVTLPTTTGVVDRLERRGLVARITGADDRRKVWLSLTDSGRELVSGVRSAGARRAHQVFEQLTQDERQALQAALGPVSRVIAVKTDLA